MRRKDKQIDNKEIINKILKESVICRVAFFDEEYPYLLPFNYGMANNALYIHCAKMGKKLELIKRNNKVCFEVEGPHKIVTDEVSCNWTTKYRSVIGYGKIEIVDGFEQKKKGLDVIMNHHGKPDNEYSEKLVNNMVILKLNIESVTGKQSGNWE